MKGELVGDYLDADEFEGTGEGAMAHGWGMYYALSKDVAEGYAERHGGGSYAQIFCLIFFI